MTSILVYQDYVHNCGALYKALRSQYGNAEISFTDADEIRHGILNDQVKAFIMPGGASRYVADKLDGEGNRKIKEYVSNGGLYIGICAGAYYACQRTEWLKGQEEEICVDNELGFFPGIAVGPVKQFIRDDLDLSFTAAKTKLKTKDNQEISALYWGGPVFTSEKDDFEVLAKYSLLPEQPSAIVAGQYNKGRYLLFSPHLEIDSEQLELMNFNVSANNLRDVAALPDRSGLSTDYFFSLLNRYL